MPLLMMVANLAPHKGQETAIRAVADLKRRGQRVNLWLVGSERIDGQGYLGHLQNLVRDLQLHDSVRFAGFRDDVPDLLAAADMLLLPSTSEGLPLVVLEAQASRSVVLAAPTAGIPEVIQHGKTGYLIDAEDYVGYADRISRLLRSPGLADSIATAAYEYVHQHHDLTSYCRRIVDEYDLLLADH
jgi:glycosyltransferase involved in cell wall biosynthesis